MVTYKRLQTVKAAYQYFGKKELPILSNFVTRQCSVLSQPRRSLSQQASLPRLPVPPLKSTLDKYLRFVEPLVTSEDFEYTKNVVKKFLEQPGPLLQERLVDRSKKTENWLAEWWMNAAYLDFRSPVIINSSPGIRLPSETFNNEDEWLLYAARFICGALDFKQLVDTQRLPVDMMGKSPLCMMQYYCVLNTCRIPGVKRDRVVHYGGRPDSPSHICVMHNNRVFALELIDKDTRQPLSLTVVKQQLKRIVAQSQIKGPPVGLLTAEHRNSWGQAYERMSADSVNARSFRQLESCVFVLCLDRPVLEGVPPEDVDSCIARNMLHGGGHKANSANRWFDKTVQFIVSRDGAVGFCYEHSPAEGPPVMAMVDHVFRFLRERPPADDGTVPGEALAVPEELKFNLDVKTKEQLDAAKTNIWSMVSDTQLLAFTEDQFGKAYSKAQKLSPDAFIQIAFQLAFYRLYGVPSATYESGSTRKYALGRTDTIRSCGPLSVAFTHAMTDEKVGAAERARALRAAVKEHSRHTVEVLNGDGIDRHLLGLKLVALEHGDNVPELFMDTAYSKSQYYRISTSQIPAQIDASFCFGPAVPDGYGLCYNPQKDRIHFTVTACNRSPETDVNRFAKEIRKALHDMKATLAMEDQKSRL